MTDNLRLRRHLQDIEKKKESIAKLESELGGIDAKHLERERRRLMAEQQDLLKEVNGLKMDIVLEASCIFFFYQSLKSENMLSDLLLQNCGSKGNLC